MLIQPHSSLPRFGLNESSYYHLAEVSKAIHSAQSKRLQDLLIRYRTAAGMTQAELAAKIGRAQTFVSKVELGERRIDIIELLQMLAAMRVDPLVFVAALIRRK